MCSVCDHYLGSWSSHSPNFPDQDWEILSSEELEVGTHAPVTVMKGTARCRSCGRTVRFGCSYGDGYYFAG